MLIVTIELIPATNPSQREHLGTMTIANDGSGTVETGNYEVMLSKWRRPRQAWRRGRVTGFPRKRLGPYDLLYRALAATVGGRNRGVTATEDTP